MKKQLMATTALVAAGVLAGATAGQAQGVQPTLTLGGWFEGIVGYVNDDDPNGDHVDFDVQQDSEIHFKGEVRLDNGIRIRTRVELEAQSANSSDTIDEAYIDVSGSFGAIRIGSEDNAAHLMVTPHMGHWATSVGQNVDFDVTDWIEQPPGMSADQINRLDLGDADSEKVTYFTPRVAGFQLGATYMPSFSEGDNGEPELKSENPHTGYAVAASWQGKFGAFGLGLAAGYATAQSAAANQSEPEGYALGASVDFANFRVAAGYHREWNRAAETAATDPSTESYTGGIRYKLGKNNFSLGYSHAEAPGSRAIADDDEYDKAIASYRRDLGPGVQYRLNLMWADFDGEGSTADNDGYAVTTSVRVAF